MNTQQSKVQKFLDEWEDYTKKDDDIQVSLEFISRDENHLTFRTGSFHLELKSYPSDHDTLILSTYYLEGYPKTKRTIHLKELDVSISDLNSFFVWKDKEPPITLHTIRDFPKEYIRQYLKVLKW